MKSLTNYRRVAQYIDKVFKLVNDEYFDGSLEMPTITIQSTVGAYGHVTTSKVWKTETGAESYELNLGADYLDRPIECIVSTLIHEACHLYAMQNGIKDTSNRGVYHNRKFAELAESRGLIVSKHEKYGYTCTEPSDQTIAFCLKNDLDEIRINRGGGYTFTGIGTPKAGNGNTEPKAKKPSSTRKYVCPVCGNSCRATKDINLICGDCMVQMVKQD